MSTLELPAVPPRGRYIARPTRWTPTVPFEGFRGAKLDRPRYGVRAFGYDEGVDLLTLHVLVDGRGRTVQVHYTQAGGRWRSVLPSPAPGVRAW